MTPRPFVRASSLEALRRETFDLVVVGGGITGAGVVLDAAARGLSAALIERGDFAQGTSSKSSKLVHGGIRYLQQGDVRLVYQALAERQRLLDNAPHLVRPLPFLIPMFGKGGVLPAKVARVLGGAMWAYDLTGGWRVGRLHKRLDRDSALSQMPTLKGDKVVSAYLYFDAAADDARLVLAVLRTAALHHGAVVANRVSAVGVSKDVSGRADGVDVDSDGERFTVRARAVVNAAGVWADEVRALDEGEHPHSIRPAKGVHVTVPWDRVRNRVATILPVPGDHRSVFVVPNGDLAYIGTTDTDYDGSIEDPQCTPEDVEYLLGAVNRSTTADLSPADVVGSWAGLRPLVRAAPTGRTADLSRRHLVGRSASGVVTITGGKLTTYREMAADTVDEVLRSVLTGRSAAGRRTTRDLPLRGAAGFDTLPGAVRAHPGVTAALVEHLGRRYGGEARVLMADISRDASLGEPLVPGLPYVRAEALFAARHEMAGSVDDVLSRRTRARLLGRDDAAASAESVGELIAAELGWGAGDVSRSVEEFRAATEHEREAAGLPETHLDALIGA